MTDEFSLRLPSALQPLVALLEQVAMVCSALSIEFFVVGALAREMFFEHMHAAPPAQATRDIDIAVFISDWESFEAVKESLVDGHGFHRTRLPHRLQSPGGLLLDVIPFGGVENEARTVIWPSVEGVEFNVAGFEEAAQQTIRVRIESGPQVRIVSPIGLFALKLISWNDDKSRRARDAVDVGYILRHFGDVCFDEIISGHNERFDDTEFDLQAVAGRVLGRGVATLVRNNAVLAAQLKNILAMNTSDEYDSPLSEAMGPDHIRKFEQRFRCLEQVRRGFSERID